MKLFCYYELIIITKTSFLRRGKKDYINCKKESGLLPVAETLVTPSEPPTEIDCGICGDTAALDRSYALQCQHRFCVECWKNWLVASFDKGPSTLLTTCPSHKCPVIIPLSAHIRFLPKDKTTKITEWSVEAFVQGNVYVAWCPAKKCTRAIRRFTEYIKGVRCTCGKRWCFDCKDDDHTPCGCAEAKAWNDRIKKEGGNAEYIIANTKGCPKCKVNIEKNQGCQHMTCSQCRYEFCWLCGGDWRGHNACNSFKKAKSGGEEDENGEWTGKDGDQKFSKDELRKSLERWVHYHDRFLAHKNSGSFATKTLSQAYQRAIQLREIKNSNLQACLFLVESAKEIIACRAVLAWSYVYAYYVAAKDNNSQRLLFESHQEKLENFTDKLHEMIEKPLGSLMENQVSRQIVHLTSVIRKFRKNVIKIVTQTPLPSILSMDKDKDINALNPKAYVAAKRKALFALLPRDKEKLKKGFSCRACTYLNKEENEWCEMCNTPRNE